MTSEPTVFLVDDDPAIIAALKDLVGLLGLKACACRSADEFLENYQAVAPACLVLDVRMPGMSGLELQKELVARGIELPTIIITGFADVRMAVEAMKGGAIEFLEKPFRTQELCDLVQKAIRLDAVNWQNRQQRERVLPAIGPAQQRGKRSPRSGHRREDQLDDLPKTGAEHPHHRKPPRRMMRKLGVSSPPN